ncbi:MAG: hypothetical protein ATN36_02115 [Epulopiscium sp. Nele67-Bin005]|nr:MAG: hypothetical protein ATN36_02115 [Epulopiscium sp. Nele67-Bin005]
MWNYAHRGASKDYPENTVLAFEQAIKQGATGVEVDVHLTKDGHLVINHDEDVARTYFGRGFIKDYTLEELKKLENRSGDCQIPTLQEVFDVIKRFNARILIEIKTKIVPYKDIEQKVIDTIIENDYLDKTTIVSFCGDSIKKCRELNDEVALGLISFLLTPDVEREAQEYGVSLLSLNFVPLTRSVVTGLKKQGFSVITYTVNNEDTMERMMDYGVNGIVTDYPGLLHKMIVQNDN